MPAPPPKYVPPPPRHPAASHPGFEPQETPTSVPQTALAQVLGTVNQGFQRIADLLAQERRITTLEHTQEIERLERVRLAERVKDLEKDVDDTGQHSRKAIEAELDRMRGAQAHWVRYVVGAIVALVAGLLVSVLTRRL